MIVTFAIDCIDTALDSRRTGSKNPQKNNCACKPTWSVTCVSLSHTKSLTVGPHRASDENSQNNFSDFGL